MEIRSAKAQRSQSVAGVPPVEGTGAAPTEEGTEAIAYFRSPRAIRERCEQIFAWVNQGHSQHFACDLQQLERVADYVISVMRCEYPDLQIPFHSRWRHFEVKNVPRLTQLETRLAGLTPLEKAAAKFDLAIVSVLLDAGAGENWRYYEQETQLNLRRSEGLAIASFQMFFQGTFSSNNLLQVDAFRLQGLTETELAAGFQVDAENPLVGINGRWKLLQKLGEVLINLPHLFGEEKPRPGNLVNYLLGKSQNGQIAASTVFSAVLEGFSDIWQED